MAEEECRRAFEEVRQLHMDEGISSDHEWHFRYNRRLQCFSHSVSCLTFSTDGAYLVSGTASGDVKVWDTNCWAEAGRLKGSSRKEPRALVISPSQRWLVSAYPSVLQVYQCWPPFRLEQTLPAGLDPATKEPQEWMCCAFSPMMEVDNPGGKTGQDNHLAAFSSAALVVLDYSTGWGTDTPRRTRSLMQSSTPTCLAYTSCGWWIICGFESGAVQVWNAFSLTLEKMLNGHTDCVNCLAASPRAAGYEPRFVSCGVDQTLRVWHSQGWILEQHVHDTRCDRNGVRKVTFSSTGHWLVSVASELSIWRVCVSRRGHLVLALHQRLSAICGAEGLRAAALCCNGDAIAAGSRDGVLGLWTKYPGCPPDPAEPGSAQAAQAAAGGPSEPWQSPGLALPRPMQRLTPQGLKPLARPSEWLQKAHMRTLSMSSLATRAPLSTSPVHATMRRVVGADRPGSTGGGARPAPTASAPGSPGASTRPLALQRSPTMPDLARRRPPHQNFEIEDMLSQMDGGPLAAKGPGGAAPARALELPDCVTPARRTMLHACSRGKVTRISLEPKVITDHPN